MQSNNTRDPLPECDHEVIATPVHLSGRHVRLPGNLLGD